MNSNVLCDIGDGQSIAESLSTFSAHIKGIIEILQDVSNESLVLLDELGSGTDPSEGMGLAVSILEELRKRECLFVATTHYPEIKEFADKSDVIVNAKMGFDRESLKPLYKLEIGSAGESCAFHIARKMGFPEHMLQAAFKAAYSNTFEIDEHSSISKARPSSGVIQKSAYAKPSKKNKDLDEKFAIGDSVKVYPKKEVGIVYAPTNSRGEVGVQIKDKKILINHKRLKLLVSAKELYPEDYDFSIVFDSVENRKARHIMSKRHDANVAIEYED